MFAVTFVKVLMIDGGDEISRTLEFITFYFYIDDLAMAAHGSRKFVLDLLKKGAKLLYKSDLDDSNIDSKPLSRSSSDSKLDPQMIPKCALYHLWYAPLEAEGR